LDATWLVAFSSHCHIVTTSNPEVFRSRFTRLSRNLLPWIFFSQKETFVFGSCPFLHECPCQKQPCTKTTHLFLLFARSGFPLRERTFSRYRRPACAASLRTASSGSVPATRTAFILLVVFSEAFDICDLQGDFYAKAPMQILEHHSTLAQLNGSPKWVRHIYRKKLWGAHINLTRKQGERPVARRCLVSVNLGQPCLFGSGSLIVLLDLVAGKRDDRLDTFLQGDFRIVLSPCPSCVSADCVECQLA
jgi:hypothetical protein